MKAVSIINLFYNTICRAHDQGASWVHIDSLSFRNTLTRDDPDRLSQGGGTGLPFRNDASQIRLVNPGFQTIQEFRLETLFWNSVFLRYS